MKLVGASLFTLSLISGFVFLIIALIMIYANNMNIWLVMGLTIVFNFIMWLVGPWITDWINKFFYKVRFLSQEEVRVEYPSVFEIANKVSSEHNFKFPKIGVIADDNPTAFCYGSGRYNSRLIVTNGLFKYLNADEQKAVVAHEMGHIVNRDFIVMMIASTLVQLLYEIYAVLIRTRGRKNPLPAIGLASYALYVIASYLLLFLSRTRETLADNFAATITEPEDLSNALIKIAYGIVSEGDSDVTTRLLKSTRHMGLVDVKDAKHTGGVSYITNSDKEAVSEAMLFDAYSPWAKLIELNSTHPLTGKRIKNLSTLPSHSGRTFSYNVEATAQRTMLDRRKLWNVMWRDLGVLLLPYVLAVAVGLATKNIGLGILVLGIGFIFKTNYRFPRGATQPTTVLEQMRNPYASPLKGVNISLQGQAVGKGVPGFVFGEDMMYQDRTGLIFMNYHSAFSFLGNLFFGLKKVKELLGINSVSQGWFYRSISSYFVLKRMDVEGREKPIKSWLHAWSYVGGVLLVIIGAGLAFLQLFGGRY